MIKYKILNWFITFSSFPDPAIKGEIAIFLFNSVVICNSEQVEILLEQNILVGLSRVIK
jgi:hypothetical protein